MTYQSAAITVVVVRVALVAVQSVAAEVATEAVVVGSAAAYAAARHTTPYRILRLA